MVPLTERIWHIGILVCWKGMPCFAFELLPYDLCIVVGHLGHLLSMPSRKGQISRQSLVMLIMYHKNQDNE
jgi:hypothetical protein